MSGNSLRKCRYIGGAQRGWGWGWGWGWESCKPVDACEFPHDSANSAGLGRHARPRNLSVAPQRSEGEKTCILTERVESWRPGIIASTLSTRSISSSRSHRIHAIDLMSARRRGLQRAEGYHLGFRISNPIPSLKDIVA